MAADETGKDIPLPGILLAVMDEGDGDEWVRERVKKTF